MYMKPTLAGGVLCAIHASTHSPAFLSQHIGSGPGVAGLSGMHVQPFVPLRIVRILPDASIAMTVAFPLILRGAALSALLIRVASLGASADLASPARMVNAMRQLRPPAMVRAR